MRNENKIRYVYVHVCVLAVYTIVCVGVLGDKEQWWFFKRI